MKYRGSVTIRSTLDFEAAARELNRFLAPLRLQSTDRFDEVPGFISETEGVALTLQGIPADFTEAERRASPYYYLELRVSPNVVQLLPRALSGFPVSNGAGASGYVDVSEFLCKRLNELTALSCEVAG